MPLKQTGISDKTISCTNCQFVVAHFGFNLLTVKIAWWNGFRWTVKLIKLCMVLFTKLNVALRSNFRCLERMIVVLLHMIKVCVILCCQEGSLLVLCKIFYELWPTCLDRQPARRTLFCNSLNTSLPQASSLVENHAFIVITAWRTFFFLSHPVFLLPLWDIMGIF